MNEPTTVDGYVALITATRDPKLAADLKRRARELVVKDMNFGTLYARVDSFAADGDRRNFSTKEEQVSFSGYSPAHNDLRVRESWRSWSHTVANPEGREFQNGDRDVVLDLNKIDSVNLNLGKFTSGYYRYEDSTTRGPVPSVGVRCNYHACARFKYYACEHENKPCDQDQDNTFGSTYGFSSTTDKDKIVKLARALQAIDDINRASYKKQK